MKKEYKKGKRDTRRDMQDVSDIDSNLVELKKNFDDELSYKGLMMIEESTILEIIYQVLCWYDTKNIQVPDECFSILFDDSLELYDKAISFIGELFDLVSVNDKERIGYFEFAVGIYQELYKAEIKRVKYIKEKAAKEGVNINKVGNALEMYKFIFLFTEYIKKSPHAEKSKIAISALNYLPEGTFNKIGITGI